MLNQDFAARLLPWATRSFFISFSVLLAGVGVAYGLGERSTMTLELLGHWFIALGAVGIKMSYFARLAALDVLKPHPDGWLREAPEPESLPRLEVDTIEPPPTRKQSA